MAWPCRSWHGQAEWTRPGLGSAEVIGGRGVYGQAQESEGDLQDMVEVRGEGWRHVLMVSGMEGGDMSVSWSW